MSSVVAKTGLGKVGGTIFICTISSQTGKFRTEKGRSLLRSGTHFKLSKKKKSVMFPSKLKRPGISLK